MKIWTLDEIDWLGNQSGLTTKKIYEKYCEEFGYDRSYNSVQKKVQQLLPSKLLLSEEITETPLLPTKVNKLKILKDAKNQATEWAAEVAKATELITNSSSFRPKQSKGSSLVLLLSDLHFGKQTKDFNLAEAQDRIAEIPTKLLEQIGEFNNLDEIVVVLGGDIVEGEDIFSHQAHSIECSVIEQAQVSTISIWHLLHSLHRAFPDCDVRVETCPGNHGRMSKTANPESNWDNVVYQQLGLIYNMWQEDRSIEDSKWLNISVNTGEFKHFKVKDKWVLLNHYGVKHTGTPSMLVKLAGWNQMMPFDVLIHGHWHKWEIGSQFGKAIVKNGCLCGSDDLSMDMGVCDPARQAYFTITPAQPIKNFSCLEWN